MIACNQPISFWTAVYGDVDHVSAFLDLGLNVNAKSSMFVFDLCFFILVTLVRFSEETRPCITLRARALLMPLNCCSTEGHASMSQATSKLLTTRISSCIAQPAHELQGHALRHCNQALQRRYCSPTASKGGKSKKFQVREGQKVLSID